MSLYTHDGKAKETKTSPLYYFSLCEREGESSRRQKPAVHEAPNMSPQDLCRGWNLESFLDRESKVAKANLVDSKTRSHRSRWELFQSGQSSSCLFAYVELGKFGNCY
jgi:hypothetical protein